MEWVGKRMEKRPPFPPPPAKTTTATPMEHNRVKLLDANQWNDIRRSSKIICIICKFFKNICIDNKEISVFQASTVPHLFSNFLRKL